MKRLKEKLMKLNNRGLTLVELICSVAILSLVGLTIGGILVVSAKSYDSGINEVELQQEAQMVVNQINDLVIDTTASSVLTFDGTKLTIPQGDKKHYVEYDSATKSLYYSFEDSTGTSSKELMATGIASFSADTSSFADSGNLYVDIALERETKGDPRQFQATFQITSRNGIVDTTPSVSIDVVDDIVLEPNQSYEFTPVVVGISNQAVTWTIAGGNTDSTTSMLGNKINIGKDETGSIIHLLVQTNEVDGDGNPMAVRPVRVRIRRVNTIKIMPVTRTGDAFKKDTEYTFAADLTGTYLDKEPWGWDSDYVDPFTVKWSASSTGSVATALPTITEVAKDPLNPSHAVITVKLNEDMPKNSTITITVKAMHPEGVNSDGSNANKSGLKYATVIDDIDIDNSGFLTLTHGMARGSDDDIATFDIDALKALLISKFGNGTYQLSRIYRFREEGSGEAGWTRWYGDQTDTDLGFGFDAGTSVNIRPKFGHMMRYGKRYDFQCKLCMINQDTGVTVWPFVDTPLDQYFISGTMDRVHVTFTSTTLGFTEEKGWAASKGTKISANTNGIIFSVKDIYSLGGTTNKGNYFSYIHYILERKEGADWVKVQDLQSGKECRVQLNGVAGEYRVLVWMDERNVTKDDSTGTITDKNDAYVYNIYELGGNEGIFYFTAE